LDSVTKPTRHSQTGAYFPHIQLNLPRDSITDLARCLIKTTAGSEASLMNNVVTHDTCW